MGEGGVHGATFGVTAAVATELGDDCSIDSDGVLFMVRDVFGGWKV